MKYPGGKERMEAKDISIKWVCSDKEGMRKVNNLLEVYGLNFDAIMPKASSLKLNDIERIDKLISSYDYRKSVAMREIEVRRDLIAKRLREAATVDVDFK